MKGLVNRILRNELFLQTLGEIDRQETDRFYCRHGEEHLLAVARTAALIAFDEDVDNKIDRELLYASALLHDLGRVENDADNHEIRSVELAGRILDNCGISAEDKQIVLTAISEHRSSWVGERSLYGHILYRADKESRPCFACPASDSCSWPNEKKNLAINY